MNKLLDGIESKREAIVTGRPDAIEADLPAELEQAVAGRLRRAADEDVVHRIWHRDGTLWAPAGTPEVTDRLGWLDISEKMLDHVDDLERVRRRGPRRRLHRRGAAAAWAARASRPRCSAARGPSQRCACTCSTRRTRTRSQATVDAIDLDKTLFIVSSKSGGTIETMSQFKFFHERQPRRRALRGGHRPGHVARQARRASTASGACSRTTRRSAGATRRCRTSGSCRPRCIGVDIRAVLEAAEVAVQNCQLKEGNSGLWLGIALGELARNGRDKLTFVVDEPLSSFGLWAEQLVAESTGKHGRGILPIADEPLVDPGAYGQDRVFVHIASGDERNAAHVAALRKAGHPTITVHAEGPADLGRIFFYSEFATAVAGWVLEINPFDQPNVQEAKDNTSRVLKEGAPDLDPGSLDELLGGLAPPRYVAILAYLPYSEETDAAVARLRAKLITEHGVATTFGYGPRYLHSTGQFHKGGPPVGAFVEIVDEPQTDLEVPGEPYTFAQLIRAQADGDLQTLRSHGLDAVRVGKEIL